MRKVKYLAASLAFAMVATSMPVNLGNMNPEYLVVQAASEELAEEENTDSSVEDTQSTVFDMTKEEPKKTEVTENSEISEEAEEGSSEEELIPEGVEATSSETAEQASSENNDEVIRGTCGKNVTWTFIDGTLEISGTGEMSYDKNEYGDIIGPWRDVVGEEIKKVIVGEGVTNIAENAFKWQSKLEEVELPNSLVRIDDGAFHYCQSLKHIEIPSGVTEIGDGAFYITGLESIELPNSLLGIGVDAFYECSDLQTVEIPGGVQEIKTGTFAGCTSLQSVIIPESVSRIGAYAFFGDKSLKNLSIPSSVKMIGSWAYGYTEQNFGEMRYDELLSTYFTKYNNVTVDGYTNSAAQQYANRNGIKFQSIGEVEEKEAAAVASGTCGSKVNWVFDDQGTLTISGSGDMTKFHYIEFENKYGEPDGTWDTPWLEYGPYINNIVIEKGVTSLGDYAFKMCDSLCTVSLPDGLTKIGNDVFDSLFLEKITLPSSLKSIGQYAFYNCVRSKSVTIPPSVTSIGKNAFGYTDGERIKGFAVHGYYGSAAEKYASSSKLTFKGKVNLKAKMTLPTIPNNKLYMKVNQSTSGLKVKGMISGDAVKSIKSSKTSIVSVSNVKNNQCTLKAKKTGTSDITITLKSGLTKKFTVSVQKSTVKTKQLQGLSSSASVKKGKTTTLKPVKVPFTSQQSITYKSSNKKIATVTSSGKITGKKKGTTYITVKSGSVSKKIKLTVK